MHAVSRSLHYLVHKTAGDSKGQILAKIQAHIKIFWFCTLSSLTSVVAILIELDCKTSCYGTLSGNFDMKHGEVFEKFKT